MQNMDAGKILGLQHISPHSAGLLVTEISAQSLKILLHILRGEHLKWQKY